MFNLIHIAFAIFQNTEYLDPMGMQQLLWKYWESIGHPALQNLVINFTNQVGEDINLQRFTRSYSSIQERTVRR